MPGCKCAGSQKRLSTCPESGAFLSSSASLLLLLSGMELAPPPWDSEEVPARCAGLLGLGDLGETGEAVRLCPGKSGSRRPSELVDRDLRLKVRTAATSQSRVALVKRGR